MYHMTKLKCYTKIVLKSRYDCIHIWFIMQVNICTIYLIQTIFYHPDSDSFWNIEEKGEIAHHKQFHLFPQLFQLYIIYIITDKVISLDTFWW